MTAIQTQPVSLLNKNSLGVPALCDKYIEVVDTESLITAVRDSRQAGQKILILGEGTNVVFADDFSGNIICPAFRGIKVLEETDTGGLIRVGAGENWHQLVCWTLEQGYSGLENLALIPGSCGAAPVQNIGAYGVELDQLLVSVEYFDLDSLESKVLTNSECGFGYRESRFKKDLLDKAVITHISLALTKQSLSEQNANIEYPALKNYLLEKQLEPIPNNVFEAVCDIRRSKLPDVKEIPNAGSFFKNPVIDAEQFQRIRQQYSDCPGYEQPDSSIKIPAAWLIDSLGWKGKHHSGVGMHSQQALVLVNPGLRKGAQILQFAQQIQNDVEKNFGISLEIEPRVIGSV